MKGVTDIFISKEKLAVFWFLISCACLVGTGWYVHEAAVASRGSMLYVPIEKSDFYLDSTLKDQDLNEVVDYHTRHALETFLNRGPKGPLTAERLSLLFAGNGIEQVVQDVKDTRYDFRSRNIHQLMEVGPVRVEHSPDGTAETVASGQLIRVSVDPTTKEGLTQSFSVMARMNWGRNQNLRDGRRFPFVCTGIEYSISEVSSSEGRK